MTHLLTCDCGIRLRVFVVLKEFNAVKLRSSRRRQQSKGEGDVRSAGSMCLIWSPVVFAWVLMMAARPLGSSERRETSINPTKRSRLGTNRARERATPEFHKQSTSGAGCVRRSPVVLEDSVSTAERLRNRIVVRAQHVARSVDLRLRRDEIRKEHVANTVQANAQASCDHDRGALLLTRVRQRVSSNIAAEECSRRGRPCLRKDVS